MRDFADGTKSYSNRFFLWENIPAALVGTKFVQNAGGMPLAREIKIKEPGVVYVAVDANVVADNEILRKLGFIKLQETFSYSDVSKTVMSLFGKITDRSIKLPEPTSFSGFVVIGDLR